MTATIIRGGHLLAKDGLQEGWGLRIEGGTIAQVGKNELLTVCGGDRVVDVPDQMLLPGFVNGHNHMYGALSHGITVEAMVTEFSSFLEDFWWPCVEDRVDHELARVTARWACAEMIDSGITSFVDILEAPGALSGVLEAQAEVVEAAGLRGILSFEACQRVSEKNGLLGIEENADFIRGHNGKEGLLRGMMSVHTLFTCNEAFIRTAHGVAGELSADFHMHLSESPFEPAWTQKHLGKSPVEAYEAMGALDSRVFASQLVQVDGSELDILARNGVRGVTMPLSNCEVGGGIAPVTEMLCRGMQIGLGTDGYINNFFEVMRGAFLIHKAALKDPQAMPAKRVYEMATSMGAKAAGFDGVGRLEEGCFADVISVSTDTPTPINKHNVYDQLVLFRNPHNVRNVWVHGKRLKQDGRIVSIDSDRAKAQLREATERFWKRC